MAERSLMDIVNMLTGGALPVDHEQKYKSIMKEVERIEWAFDGDDVDAKHIQSTLPTVKYILDFIWADHNHADKAACSRAVGDLYTPFVDAAWQWIDTVMEIATMRVIAQGRWFTDEGGPDYKSPEQQEQEAAESAYPLDPDDPRHASA